MLLTGSILLYMLVFVAGACFFYLLNGIIYLVPRKLGFKEGYRTFRKAGYRPRYLVSIVLGGAAAVASQIYFGSPAASVTVILFLGLLLVVGFVDWDTMEIPDSFVAAAFASGLLSVFTMPDTGILSRIIGIFAVSVPLLLLTLAVPGAFGGGDIKLMAGCGLFLGAKLCLLSLAFAVLTGGPVWDLASAYKEKGRQGAFCLRAFSLCRNGSRFVCGGLGIELVYGIALLKIAARKETICLSTVIRLRTKMEN